MYPPRTRPRSPSPPYRPRATRLGLREETVSRGIPLPGIVAPAACLQLQAPSRRSFAAGAEGSLLSLCGGCLVERHISGAQEILCGPRSRPLTCFASSPCGRLWAVGESYAATRHGQVTIVSQDDSQPVMQLSVGFKRGVRNVAWAASGELLACIAEEGGDQAGDQQLIVWSWPAGERLAMSACGRGTLDLAGSLQVPAFVTVGTVGARTWTLLEPQELVTYSGTRARSPGSSRGSTGSGGSSLPLRLFPRPLPVGATPSGRRRSADDGATAATWGLACDVFLATRQGSIWACNVECKTQSHVCSRELGRK
ncbi:unnamed protein product, partial [Polarella glacialis]